MTFDMPLPGGTTTRFPLPDDAPDRVDPMGMAEEAADLPPAEALQLLDAAVFAAASDAGALGDDALEDETGVVLEARPPDDPADYDPLALYDLAAVLAARAAARAETGDLPGALADFDASIAVLASLHHVPDDGALLAFGYDAAHLDAERADVTIERALARTHDGQDAADDLDRARALASDDAGVLNNLADALRKAGRADEALATAERSLERVEDDELREIVLETRAEILADIGRAS